MDIVRVDRSDDGLSYIEEVESIADSFRYEDCEVCGQDLDRHTIGPDPLGHAHLFCMEVRWVLDGSGVVAAGTVGGDAQVGEAWSVRYRAVGEPQDGLHAILTLSWYADGGSAQVNGEQPEEYGVTCCTEYLICEDPSDLGGTEEWSDLSYEEGYLAYPTADEAEKQARLSAERAALAADSRLTWDGRSREVL